MDLPLLFFAREDLAAEGFEYDVQFVVGIGNCHHLAVLVNAVEF